MSGIVEFKVSGGATKSMLYLPDPQQGLNTDVELLAFLREACVKLHIEEMVYIKRADEDQYSSGVQAVPADFGYAEKYIEKYQALGGFTFIRTRRFRLETPWSVSDII